MEKLKEWVKSHKGLTAALVGGIIVLIYLYSRRSASQTAAQAGGGGLSGSDYASITSAELTAATQQNAQQAALQLQTNQFQAQLQEAQLKESGDLAIAKLQQDVSLANIYASQNVQLTTVGAQKDVAVATLQENAAVAGDRASIELGLINILAGKGNTYSPTVAPAMFTPTTISSAPAAYQSSPAAASGTTTEAVAVPVVGVLDGSHPLLGPIAPSGALSGYSEVAGVQYPSPAAPFAADYTYPSEPAAIQAGALVLKNGQYVPANPGLQITY